MANNNPLLGLWSLQAFELVFPDGSIKKPFGDDPIGYINYEANGFMTAHLAKRHRQKSDSDSLFALMPDECQTMMFEHGSYCGRYRMEEGRVFHEVEVASFANFEGQTLERAWVIDANGLTLTNFLDMPDVGQVEFVARWQKA